MSMGNMEERTTSRPWLSGWLEKIIWEVDMTISVRTQETCPRYYFNVSKVEDLWNGFRVYLDNGFYKDFNKDWWWEEEK